MLCRKNLIIGFGIFLPVLLSVLFVSPSYAVSDVSVTYNFTDTITSGQAIFPTCDSTCISQYSYLIATLDNAGGRYNNPSYIEIYLNNYYVMHFSFSRSTTDIQSLFIGSTPSLTFVNNTPFVFITNSSMNPVPTSITFTLTESLGSCPEPEPCPVVPDNPYDEKLDNITHT